MNTRKYPRTLQEAFGPYTSRDFAEDREVMPIVQLVAIVITVLAAAFFIAQVVLA